MSEMNRREALALMALAPLGTVTAPTPPPATPAPATAPPPRAQERFLTPHEMATVVVLAEITIPADERSGGAAEAGAPEFIDFILRDTQDDYLRHSIRGGLAWLDAESRRRWGHAFVDAADSERVAILDDIAWPERARPEMSHGVDFFNRFRDLVATGFWTSAVGIEDLRYVGNAMVPGWDGCPPEALRRLGVSYDGLPAAGDQRPGNDHA